MSPVCKRPPFVLEIKERAPARPDPLAALTPRQRTDYDFLVRNGRTPEEALKELRREAKR